MSIVLLAACSDYAAATSTAAVPVITVGNTSVATLPVATPKTTAASGLKQTVPTPAPVSTPPSAGVAKGSGVPALSPTTGFYELPFANSKYYLHMPSTLKPGKALQIVIAVHGMGGNGLAFGQPLIQYADEYGLVLVAPTMQYDQNIQEAAPIAANDAVLLPELHKLIEGLPGVLAYPVSPRVLLFGFSRGAQIVHRYATFYPENVIGVAAMSAGNYTLPFPQMSTGGTIGGKLDMSFPFGVANLQNYVGHTLDLDALRRVSFWLAVGGADNANKDVPTAWSPYLGTNRVQRATHYYEALRSAGVEATFTVFPGVGHAVCTEMKQEAFAFFNKLVV